MVREARRLKSMWRARDQSGLASLLWLTTTHTPPTQPEYLGNIYTVSTQCSDIVSTQYLYTTNTISTHNLQYFYTVSTEYLNNIYTIIATNYL